jgi:hypothetical protein
MTHHPRRGAGESAPSAPDFEPVPARYRRDGWTPARQRAFILALWACRCVLEACRRVGMSGASAYKLYERPDAASFRRAWNAALAAAAPERDSSTTASPAPSAPMRPLRARFTAGALRPVPKTASPWTSWQPSTSSTSSTSAATPAETNGMCRSRRVSRNAAGRRGEPLSPSPSMGEGRVGVDSETRSVPAETPPHPNPSPSRGGDRSAHASGVDSPAALCFSAGP